jgi:hypothetical protein
MPVRLSLDHQCRLATECKLAYLTMKMLYLKTGLFKRYTIALKQCVALKSLQDAINKTHLTEFEDRKVIILLK